MAYPKPLSEKSIAKMYREANINEETADFLHRFFLAAANLYGAAVLRDLWEILRDTAPRCGMSRIKRKDIVAFSSIVRRENVPYYVFEADELYSEEKRADLDREIVHKSLIKAGYGKMALYYNLSEEQADKPYYVPEDFLSYAEPKETPEETDLLKFLRKLKVTAKSSKDRYGREFICNHLGETLDSFSFRNSDEEFDYKWLSGEFQEHPSRNEKALHELTERTGGSEAEKIFRIYREACFTGSPALSDSLQKVNDELTEVGVQLSLRQFNELSTLLVKFNNESHLWCNRGWTPTEMSKHLPRSSSVTMSLGPALKQAIAEGKISREELEKELGRYKIKLIE